MAENRGELTVAVIVDPENCFERIWRTCQLYQIRKYGSGGQSAVLPYRSAR